MNIKIFIPGETCVPRVLRQILDIGVQSDRQEEADVVVVFGAENLKDFHPGTDNPTQDFVLLSACSPESLPSRTVWLQPTLNELLPHLQKLSLAKA